MPSRITASVPSGITASVPSGINFVMSTYLYRAKRASGEAEEGSIEAASREEALSKIDRLGFFPVWVEEGRSGNKIKNASLSFSRRVPRRDVVEWTHQLSTLINSGSPLASALDMLIRQTEQKRLRPIMLDIAGQVKEGQDFSRALAKYPNVFPPLYISLVGIGEASGALGENLRRIADFLEEENDLRTNISSVSIYPALIIGGGAITVFVLLRFVIPKLVRVFQEIGQTLPLPTRILIGASDILSQYGLVLLGGCILVFFAVRNYFRNSVNKLKWHRFKLSMPLLGRLLRKIEVCQFSRTLSMLLRNGVPIEASLRVLSPTVSNLFFRRELKNLQNQIREGGSLSRAMRKIGVFDAPFVNSVAIGEGSGQLDKILDTFSRDYQKEIDRRIKRLVSLLEPFLILGVGLVVGFVVLAMLFPVFEMDFDF